MVCNIIENLAVSNELKKQKYMLFSTVLVPKKNWLPRRTYKYAIYYATADVIKCGWFIYYTHLPRIKSIKIPYFNEEKINISSKIPQTSNHVDMILP